MKSRVLPVCLTILLTGGALFAQFSGDVIGIHDLGPGSKSPITGARPDFCNYCHASHSGLNLGLWNQTLTRQSYTVYHSDTEKNRGTQPMLGDGSNLCLSCHDGTVAVGAVNWFDSGFGRPGSHGPQILNPRTAGLQGLSTGHGAGNIAILSGVHPVAMPYPYGGVGSTYNGTTTGANFIANQWQTPPLGNIRLYMQNGVNSVILGWNGAAASPAAASGLQGNAGIECSSCHDPHNKITVDGYFLVGMGTGSGSTYLCNMCHMKY